MIDAVSISYKLGDPSVPYRCASRQKMLDVENYQGNAVVNYTDREVPYTRIIEHKHFEFGKQPTTDHFQRVFLRSGSRAFGARITPINDEKNNELFAEVP